MSRKVNRRSFLKSGGFFALIVGGSLAGIFGYLASAPAVTQPTRTVRPKTDVQITLPAPKLTGAMSLEAAIATRRSLREYLPQGLSLEHIAQLLWAAQGITEPNVWVGLRTTPSAGGLYPLELYLVVRESGVVGLNAGVYRYRAQQHSLDLIALGDFSRELMAAAVDQQWVADAAANFVLTAVPQRTLVKYGDRSWQYIWQESGHVAQNLYLQATTLGFGATVIGAFFEDEIRRILGITAEETPVYIATVGVPIK